MRNRPSARVRAEASPADALIAAKSAIRPAHPASAECIAELAKVCAHNDISQWRNRIGADAAIEMCRKMGWTGAGRTALDSLCKAFLGRKSYGTA